MWKDVLGYENIYQINEYGDIKDVRSKKLRSPYITKKGYKSIDLYKDGKREKFLIHRLVAINFIPNPDNLPIVLHKDNVKLNTHYSNLKWGTYSENNSQAIRDGLNTVPRPDNRKYYEIYDELSGDRILCHGASDIIQKIGYGNDNIIRNILFRQSNIRKGEYTGYKIRKNEDIIQPIYFEEN
jgi:hypothetical protein